MYVELLVDALLVVGFGIQHSMLAMVRVKKQVKSKTGMTPLAWRSFESLCNVIYILVAAALWQSTDVVMWEFNGATAVAISLIFAASWAWYWYLHLVEYDCGLAFGSTTLVSQICGRPQFRLIPWKVGSRRWIRFPVHTAFFGMFFALPTMTADLLVLAVVLNIYNVIGSILYDLRLIRASGESYRSYMAVTGLIWPPVYRAPLGARDIKMERPEHWDHPVQHLPGLFVGIALGALYWQINGLPELSLTDMATVGASGLIGAVLAGSALGFICRPDHCLNWNQQQTNLSTTVALAAATGVVGYAAFAWFETTEIPAFAVFLPLWFTVQYLGHVAAVFVRRDKWAPVKQDDSLANGKVKLSASTS